VGAINDHIHKLMCL